MSLPARVASLTPAALDELEAEARDAIERVTDPDEAEVLLRKVKVAEDAARLARIGGERAQRWAGLKLLAERKYGELLGPAEATPPPPGGVSTTNAMSGSDRTARHAARNVAAVPEPAFNEYVETADKPSRAGLMAVHYSSATDEWATPQDFFDRLAQDFDFDLDVCALASSAKCERFFSPEDNGLEPVTHAENMARGAHALKTHCPQGHPYAGNNLKLWRGDRSCRVCANGATRAYRRRKAAQAKDGRRRER